MAGLVPATYVSVLNLKTWMPGTRLVPGPAKGRSRAGHDAGTIVPSSGMTDTRSTRRLDQPFGGGAGFLGDLGAGQHASDLLTSAFR
jgi:hypothetical protein